MAMDMLQGFVLSNYRSFGAEPQLIGPLSKVNVIAGKNNTGKSNVLKYLATTAGVDFAALKKPTQGRSHEIKTPNRDPEAQSRLTDALPIFTGFPVDFTQQALAKVVQQSSRAEALSRIVSEYWLEQGYNQAWALYETCESGASEIPYHYDRIADRAAACASGPRLDEYLSRMIREHRFRVAQSGGAVIEMLHHRIAENSRAEHWQGQVHLVDAIREVRPGREPDEHGRTDTTGELSGYGLIKRLQKIYYPTTDVSASNERTKSSISEFVKSVLADDSAEIHIPHDASVIQVRTQDRGLFDLPDMGTGIHEVVILASAATLTQNSILCIEEPELHLHPGLLRRLVAYLGSGKTSNQYIITTHSAALIDTAGASIFHATYDEGTKIQLVSSSVEQYGAVRDLGYRASDLVQANAVIWVEGPSDRTYINWWLSMEGLSEGSDYSFVMYGGSLLKHLSADFDEEVDETMVALRRLNRHVAVVIDSDKQDSTTPLNETKKRVLTELSRDDSFQWVTKGRTIENYLPEGLLQAAAKAEHPKSAVPPAKPEQFSNPFGKLARPRKANIARRVAAASGATEVPDVLDLRSKIRELADWVNSVG